jgi:hypothetical protein
MPEYKTIEVAYAAFAEVALGYADAIVAMHGVTSLDDATQNLDSSALDEAELRKIQEDCKQFYSIATAVAGGKTALLSRIGLYDLGFYFFLSRQGAGVGFLDQGIEHDVASDLDEVCASLGRLQVEIRDNRIRLSGAESTEAQPLSCARLS